MNGLRKIEFKLQREANLEKEAKDRLNIKDRETSEIVIGLCGPIGTPIVAVADTIATRIRDYYGYETKTIRISDKIIELIKNPRSFKNAFDRKEGLIEYGNFLRDEYNPSILAEVAIREISLDRGMQKKEAGDKVFKSRRKCFIINSIKNQAEYEMLRQVYGDLFYFIGVFSPIADREKSLADQGLSEPEIAQLIDRDSGEEKKYGQTVRDTFPLSDYFLRLDTDEASERNAKIDRLLNIIFKTNVMTPSTHETAMYAAFSAAANSACLSRQVGACITDNNGLIVSLGWNDVPKYGGSMYNTTGKEDNRCYNKGDRICFNIQHQDRLIDAIVTAIRENPKISEESIPLIKSALQSSRIKSLIEFSRAIHAEMHAILSADHREKINKGKLYCTTYPCHSCARHIVMAGISEVYYIEPYRKSLAISLHGDSLTEKESEKDKVKLLMYEGVSPSRYLALFKNNEFPRKNASGKYTPPEPKKATPKSKVMLDSFPVLESIVLTNLKNSRILEDETRGGEGSGGS